MDTVGAIPLYLFARPRTWSRWGKTLAAWSLQALAGLREQSTPQLVLVEWEMAADRHDYLFHEYGLRNHRVIVVVRSAADETSVLQVGFGDDVCREEVLGDQLKARRDRLSRRIHRQGVDVLTQLMDRRTALAVLEDEMTAPAAEPLWLAVFDLDHFKRVNDLYGHTAGDEVLIAMANRLLLRFVDAPVVCRFGGEEFLVALRMGREEALERLRMFRESLADLALPGGEGLTVSGGVARQRPGESIHDLIQRADQSLYRAKASGRDQIITDEEFERLSAASPLDAEVLDFENRVRVYADRLVSGLMSRGRKMVEAYREEADHDGLTGLFNRRYFDRRLDREIERSRKLNTPLTLVLLDLDDFGAVNRTYGYPAGDRALRASAETVMKTVRVVDWAGRYGGEELCAVFPDTTGETAGVIAERIRSSLEDLELEGLDGRRFRITGSFGVVSLEAGDPSSAHLIQRAGQAVRQAKAAGKNQVVRGRISDFQGLPSDPGPMRS